MRLQTALRCTRCERLPTVGRALQSDGYFWVFLQLQEDSAPFPQNFVWAISLLLPGFLSVETDSVEGSFSEERMRKRPCLFPPWRSLRIYLIQRHLINSPTETALENVHIIYQFGGGNWKQKICLFSFASLLSLLHPSSCPLVLPAGKEGWRGRDWRWGAALQCTGFPNPITGCIVSFQLKIGTFQQMENFLSRCSFLSKTFFSRKLFWWIKFQLFLSWKT